MRTCYESLYENADLTQMIQISKETRLEHIDTPHTFVFVSRRTIRTYTISLFSSPENYESTICLRFEGRVFDRLQTRR